MKRPALLFALVAFALSLAAPARAQGTLVIHLQDYAAAPITGFNTAGENAVYGARINFLREEPGTPTLNRFFVCDLNGRLYILDHTTRQFTPYLDFNRNSAETPGATSGLFPAFTRAGGYANGFVTFQFDPAYRTAGSPHFGKFYTVHLETNTADGAASRLPNPSGHPGFSNTAAYTSTPAQLAPGTVNANTRQAILIEWQDTNPTNPTFEGTARELLRIQFNGRIHPLGDLLFNPLATDATHPDWRMLYLAVGDGGAGEQNNATLHPTPQRIDVLQGKILRLSPDAPAPGTPGALRYTIPNDNPFTGPTVALPAGTRPEIYAYGFRNPHRLSFDPATGLLFACDIGFHSWEEVNVIRHGANYGWGEREGTFALNLVTGLANLPLPADDATRGYTYPVIAYPHSPSLGVGDAIAGGFVYRGTRLPALRGKFIFGDITTGELFYADLAELLAADDGNPATLARYHHLDIEWANPRASTVAGTVVRYDRMYEIVADAYRARGGPLDRLPGSATVSDLTGGGRADIRLATDNAGEIYILSKSDGMIRYVDALVVPTAAPVITRQPAAQSIAPGATVAFAVTATDAAAYQWKRNGLALPGATTANLTLTAPTTASAGAYTVDVANAAGTTTSAPAALTVSTPADPGRLANLSIRAPAGTGAQTLTVGFVLGGLSTAAPQTLLIRGVGPGLAPFGLTGLLADPALQLFRGTTALLANDNWETAGPTIAPLAAQVGAFALPAGSRDASLVTSTLTSGAYTAQITGPTTGLALAEIFDATPATPAPRQLLNVSARTTAGNGDQTLIAGFVIGGTTARTVLIRAAGPALTTFGVPGILADPTLTLYRGTEKIAENDNWQTSPDLVETFASVGAFPFTARSRDAVLYLTLPPGAYTAQVTGPTTGLALVEVYVLP